MAGRSGYDEVTSVDRVITIGYFLEDIAHERFLTALRQGPHAARISDVRATWSAYSGELGPFGVRG